MIIKIKTIKEKNPKLSQVNPRGTHPLAPLKEKPKWPLN